MSLPMVVVGSDLGSRLLLYPIRAGDNSSHVSEGGTYKYRVELPTEVVRLEPSECFEVDPDSYTTGRFLPSNHVGTISVVATGKDGVEVTFDVEVHSAKLEYETEYRWLLEQVADHAAEAVLQGFAPSSRPFTPNPEEPGELAYRSLAFLAARFRDPAFHAAIAQVLRSPHRRWDAIPEVRPLATGLRSGPGVARALVRPGRRSSPTPTALAHLPISVLPHRVETLRNEVTYDTNPNRFVRFVFQHWQSLATNLRYQIQTRNTGAGPQRRGIAESDWIIERCEEVLSSPQFAEVGQMRVFPHGDPVLLGQAGYREILRTFALSEASMSLDANLEDDMFSATQRNIATLYEYWTFLMLVDCISELCGTQPKGVLFSPSEAGLSLVLKEGSASKMSWTHERAGRQISIDLWFNQTFPRRESDGAEIASWASSIRPDASLRIRPETGRPTAAADPHLDTWIHFDAKFRMDAQGSQIAEEDPKSTAKRTDLLKMHAYRDLIRRSAGAYVLYPGAGEPHRQQEFHEVLPGIGAFPLRPGPNGVVQGRNALRDFLDETLDLTSNQASINERRRFWEREHTREDPLDGTRSVRAVDFLATPPADEQVLIGYVRPAQLEWVLRNRRYNLRADLRRGSVSSTDALLAAPLVLLWSRREDGQPYLVQLFERTGPWQIVSAAELAAEGYPTGGRASVYLVSAINPVTEVVESLVRHVDSLPLPADHAPAYSTWAQVASSH
ncbi:protein of unknown function (DUF2357)/Protein of unknown function (DUF524) [Actinobacteria bacterium IMCC26207]|nr:protein of unknown function (DUF2357)/Protein of unknown function (DUF524) [Actinobacteria bacterium IMCC26207]